MADDLSLLFKLKASNQATPAIKSVQGDVAKLRQTFGADFNAMQAVSTSALSRITASLTNVTGRVPILGGVLNNLTSEMAGAATATGQTGAQLAALGGPIGIAVAGFAATAIGAFKLTEGLFHLAVQTAEFQGKLFDMSQQTGVSVETLSALEIVAKTTGGSIESIAQSLVIFQGKLDDAQDASSKTGKQFKELGISVEDTETAFRDALKSLAAMPEGFHQTNEAAELFGRRGGKQVLAILKELDGDLDGAIQKFKEFGLVTTDEAKAADEFNDQLTLLQFQLRGLSGVIGKEVIPQALSALKDLQQALKDNKDAIDALGLAAKITSGAIGLPLKGALFLVTEQIKAQLPLLQQLVNAYEAVALAAQKIRGAGSAVKGGVDFGGATDGLKLLQEAQAAFQGSLKPFDLNAIFGVKKGGGGGSAAKDLKATLDELLGVLNDSISDAEEAFQAQSEDQKKELDKRRIALDEYVKNARAANDKLLADTLANLQKERDAVQSALAAKVINENEAAKKLRVINNAERDARREAAREQQRLDDQVEANKRKQLEATAAVIRSTLDALAQIAAIHNESEIAGIRALAEARVKSEEAAAREILAIRLAAIDREKAALETEVKATGSIEDPEEQLKARAELNLRLKVLAAERVAIEENGAREVDNARQKDLDNERAYLDGLTEVSQRIADIQRDTARSVIDLMVLHHERRSKIIKAQFNVDQEEENERHVQAEAGIAAQKAENAQRLRTIESQLFALRNAGDRETEIFRKAVQARVDALATQRQLDETERAALTQHRAILAGLQSQGVVQDYQTAIQARVTSLEKQASLNQQEEGELRQHQGILQALRDREAQFSRIGTLQARIDVLKQQQSLNLDERAELARHETELNRIRESADVEGIIERRIAVLKAQQTLNAQEEAELKLHESTLAAIRQQISFESAIRTRIAFLESQKTLNAQEQAELKQHQAVLAKSEDRSGIYDQAIRNRVVFLQQQKNLNAEEKAELERHTAELQVLAAQRDEALRASGKEGGFFEGLNTGRLVEFEDGIKSFSDASIVALSAVGSAVNGIAQGIGSLVEQWVLLGSTGPNAMRKLTASVLAGLAAQAAVHAIFELAKGFAALFFNPAEAAAHFTAAAIFGSIAGVAAIAGRKVAGDLFKPKSESDKSSNAPDALQTIIAGRNQRPQINVTVNLQGDDSKLASFITASVVQNIGDGGEIREVLATDGR